jgi:hypothetical protein
MQSAGTASRDGSDGASRIMASCSASSRSSVGVSYGLAPVLVRMHPASQRLQYCQDFPENCSPPTSLEAAVREPAWSTEVRLGPAKARRKLRVAMSVAAGSRRIGALGAHRRSPE